MAADAKAAPTPGFQISARARRLWKSITEEFEIDDPHELEILRELVRTITRIDTLERELTKSGTYITGSQGQDVLNPAIAEIRAQQATMVRLRDALSVADEAEDREAVRKVTASAKKAANARWEKVKSAERRAIEAWQEQTA